MFEQVTLTVSDLAASRRFYETVLGSDWGEFTLEQGDAVTRNLHIGFSARSRADVDAFWRAGVDAGYESDGEPGERPQYTEGYYGAFLLDPDGNSAEAVHHPEVRAGGAVDHLWIRVADLDAAAAHYRSLPGVVQVNERPGERCTFEPASRDGGTFSVVSDGRPVTENLAMALRGA
jgi:catechol 2,3-dioxygenase-like lactoylglutathione lyase family enzyme